MRGHPVCLSSKFGVLMDGINDLGVKTMNLKKIWTTTVLLSVSGAWIGCEPMSSPTPGPVPSTKESTPTEKKPEVTPDKPAESPDKPETSPKDEDKQDESKKDESKQPEEEKAQDSEKATA